jgi:hypothetical protein
LIWSHLTERNLLISESMKVIYQKRVLQVSKYTLMHLAKESLLLQIWKSTYCCHLLSCITEQWTKDDKSKKEYGWNSTLQTQWQIETGWRQIIYKTRSQDSQCMDGVTRSARQGTYCIGPSSKTLQGMWKMWCEWCQREGNIPTIQNKSIDQLCLCSVCKFYMLISFRICQVLPNWKIIHYGKILSMSQSTGC